MPLLRPSAATALRAALKSSTTAAASTRTALISSRPLSSTSRRLAADHAHEDHYDPPSGWLFGVKPGEKPERENWELIFYWGFCGSLALAVVAYAFKPDTSIQTWALEEARRRLEAEGILKEPESKQ